MLNVKKENPAAKRPNKTTPYFFQQVWKKLLVMVLNKYGLISPYCSK